MNALYTAHHCQKIWVMNCQKEEKVQYFVPCTATVLTGNFKKFIFLSESVVLDFKTLGLLGICQLQSTAHLLNSSLHKHCQEPVNV